MAERRKTLLKFSYSILVFLCMLPVAASRSPDRVAICYVLPVLWMMSCFHVMALWHVVCVLLCGDRTRDFNRILLKYRK